MNYEHFFPFLPYILLKFIALSEAVKQKKKKIRVNWSGFTFWRQFCQMTKRVAFSRQVHQMVKHVLSFPANLITSSL